MIATISKRYTFDAAHRLDRLPPEHKCHRMHGHTYEVEFAITGFVGDNGFVMDYADIDRMWSPLHAVLDHHVLNDVPGLEIPSTEVTAAWLLVAMSEALFQSVGPLYKLSSVTLRESSSTSCTMYPGNIASNQMTTLLSGVRRAISKVSA